jgi:hypothetical protein
MTRRYVTATRRRELSGQLVARDLAVLKHVSDLRFLTGAQLTRLCFADDADPAVGARAARRALLRLTRLGLLDRLPRTVGGVRAGSAGFVYCLGLAGQRLALERGWQPERRRRRSLTPGTLFLRHALQVSELHVQLTEGDRSRRFELLELSGEPACWRSFGGSAAQQSMLKPDSYARLGVGAYEDSYFFEVDRGTEGSKTIVRQLSIYIACYRAGQEQAERGVFPRVLWLAPDEHRAEAIAACVAALPRAERELFAVVRFEQAIDTVTGAGSLDPDIPPMI